ncbi:hypothetical protein [Deinococcus sp.]|uniref:hypothetical protein n=1 Tax=Deinococcus sp. TaxID=47478 RepID=UPI003C7D399C
MTQPTLFNPPHWRFYQSLEEDLEKCFKYVAPESDHFEVHSDEFAKIILLAGSEFENVLKEFKRHVAYSCSENIGGYYKCVKSNYPSISNMEMYMPRYFEFNFKPLENWSELNPPEWWTYGYNKIKHNRLDHPKAPTLKRAFHSVASLQIILLHYYRLVHGSAHLPTSIAPSLILHEGLDPEKYGVFLVWNWILPDDTNTLY